MNFTPKWNHKKISNQIEMFKSLKTIFQKVRLLTRINADLLKFNSIDLIQIIKEYESILDAYDNIKEEENNTLSTLKKIKRSPYKPILITKLKIISSSTNKRLKQLIYVLKEMIFSSFKMSSDCNELLAQSLELVSVYNRCSKTVCEMQTDVLNSNICSNTFPNILLPQTSLDFAAILQLVSHRRIEHNIINILLTLLNMGEVHEQKNGNDSSSSSIEVLRILTNNIAGENDFLKYSGFKSDEIILGDALPTDLKCENSKILRNTNVAKFLHKESIYLSNLISECHRVAPSVFKEHPNHSQKPLKDALRTIWTAISTVLDHVILWWIETPMACYSLTHVDSIRNWIFSEGFVESEEPIHSTIKALSEILSIYVSNNVWDQMFRITLITSSYSKQNRVDMENLEENSAKDTCVRNVWGALFNHLRTFNNNYLLDSDKSTSQLAVAEQISTLHRIDHSIHSMRIWVSEQSKLQSSQWVIDVVFQILNYDVRECLDILALIESPKLVIEGADVLMTVCISLRAKLILEIKANILKLRNTRDECINVLSSVCRTLSLANFSLCFPPQKHWQQNYCDDSKSSYVTFVLDQIFLPALKATNDIAILELILKLICEAWIDYIFSQRIKFTTHGALALLNDFEDVRKWISSTPYLHEDFIQQLSNHEVLHMCKGVGKVLIRKPRDMISIAHSPKHGKSSFEQSSQETRLPSEMFVSNQSHWLQLRSSSGKLSFFYCCTNT